MLAFEGEQAGQQEDLQAGFSFKNRQSLGKLNVLGYVVYSDFYSKHFPFSKIYPEQ